MVVERFPATRAFAHRIVSVLEQRSGPRGVRGRVAGWEINADAENAAEADERRVDRDVSERGAGVKRVIYRENSDGPTFGFLSLVLSYPKMYIRKKDADPPESSSICKCDA